METDLVSFVVRFARDDGADSPWRGRIVHVQSSAEQYFARMEDAVQFMQARLAAAEAAGRSTTAGDARPEGA